MRYKSDLWEGEWILPTHFKDCSRRRSLPAAATTDNSNSNSEEYDEGNEANDQPDPPSRIHVTVVAVVAAVVVGITVQAVADATAVVADVFVAITRHICNKSTDIHSILS